MAEKLKIKLAQLNPILGDIDGNIKKILEVKNKTSADTDLIVYSEQIVTGYPQEDLVLKPFFLRRVADGIKQLALDTKTGPAMLVSAPWRAAGKTFNAAFLLTDGQIEAIRYKHELPNYGVFDEVRVFEPGPLPGPISFKGFKLGVMTCEDMWSPKVTESLHAHNSDILVALNGSPFETDKPNARTDHAKNRVRETGLPLIYVNQVGGQDELVFDGGSFALNSAGEIITNLKSHTEDCSTTVWQKTDTGLQCIECDDQCPQLSENEAIYKTLVLGLRDYVNKNGFKGVILGMSGGIDSALSAAIAVDAIGSNRVRCVMMPSPFTSKDSLEDAEECTKLLNAKYDTVGIGPAMAAFKSMIEDNTDDTTAGITGENIQARSRGLVLMAISNASNYMVLSTGNKSEMSVGYATLYGDMCGGYSVLKDVYKLTVFELCKWRNQCGPSDMLGPVGRVIPERIITKPPSAELAPDQKDEDSLPPYEDLDDILTCLIEEDMGFDSIVQRGHSAETVNKVWRLLDRAEYKRRQAPPGVKITSKAFGKDRRYPITNKFVDLLEVS